MPVSRMCLQGPFLQGPLFKDLLFKDLLFKDIGDAFRNPDRLSLRSGALVSFHLPSLRIVLDSVNNCVVIADTGLGGLVVAVDLDTGNRELLSDIFPSYYHLHQI